MGTWGGVRLPGPILAAEYLEKDGRTDGRTVEREREERRYACFVWRRPACLASIPPPSLSVPSAPPRQRPLSYGTMGWDDRPTDRQTDRAARRSIYHPRSTYVLSECSAGWSPPPTPTRKVAFFLSLSLPRCGVRPSVFLLPPKWDGFGALSPERDDQITCRPRLNRTTFSISRRDCLQMCISMKGSWRGFSNPKLICDKSSELGTRP